MKKQLNALFIILAIYAISCKKSKIAPMAEAPAPAPENIVGRKISGTISPAGAVSEVKLTGQINGEFFLFSATPDDQGSYTFTNMQPGDYMLNFITTSGFIVPENIRFAMPKSTDVALANVDLKASRPLGSSTISGKVSPADAATSVTLKGSKSTVIAQINAATGSFKAVLLPEDSYTVSFQTSRKYVSPNVGILHTQTGKVSDLGAVSFTENKLISSMSATVGTNLARLQTYINPLANTGSITVTHDGTSLSVQGIYTSGSLGTPEGGTVTRLSFRLSNFTGPGTYICDMTNESRVSFYYHNTRLSIAPAIDCTSNFEDAKAVVIITAYDPIKKTITGTMSGTLKGKSAQGAVFSQEMVNGIFEITL